MITARKKQNRDSWLGDQRGLVAQAVATLLLLILSFALGYVIGKGRSKVAKTQAPTSIEEILQQELANKATEEPDNKVAKQEYKFYQKLVEKPVLSKKGVDKSIAPSKKTVAQPAASVPAPTAVKQRPSATVKKRSGYTLQVGSFKQKQAAEKMLANLQRKSVQGFVQKVDLPGKGTWWRVYVGEYADRAQAQKSAIGLKAKIGQSFLITKLK